MTADPRNESGLRRGTAIVTGAASGLGQAFAIDLAATGHDIAILDLLDATDTEQQIVAMGGHCITQQGDASDEATVRSFAERVKASDLAPVRVVINNAGISPYLPFSDTSLEVWKSVMQVNLDSAFLLTHTFLPTLKAHGNGRIVNLSSSVVWDAQIRDMSAYITSKAAIVGFTRALAGELGIFGITVNCIAPGIVLTPDIQSRAPQERLEIYRQRQAVKTLAEPGHLLTALRYLVDEFSSLVTGTTLPVNAGRVFI